jgi:putative spermidine/putrescine transport system substrate-binding protein
VPTLRYSFTERLDQRTIQLKQITKREKKMPKSAKNSIATLFAVVLLTIVAAWLSDTNSFAASDGLEDELVISIRGASTETAFKQINQMFQQKLGVKVTNVINTSGPAYAALRATTKNPSIDILQTTMPTQVQGKLDGVYVRNDPAVVTNISNVDPQFLDADGIGVAFGVLLAGIEYNIELYAKNGIPEPTSWNDLLNPALNGHLGMSTMPIGLGPLIVVALSRSNGSTEKNPDAAFKQISALGKNVIIYKSPADLDNYFQQGAVWAAMNGVPNYLALKASGVPVKMIYPKEGPVSVGPLYMSAVANAKHPKAAQAYINFLLTSEVQKVFADLALAPTIKNPDLAPDVAASFPTADQMNKLMNPDFDYINSVLDDWVQRANREFGR